MNDLVSVIIPCYQQGRFLSEAVSSLQSQTHTNWEAIIVNDGSNDDTEAVSLSLCAIDSRIHYISKPNGGLSSARNAGLAVANGDYIQFLDADDLIDLNKFEIQVNYLANHPDIDVVYGNARYFADGAFGCYNRGPYAKSPDQDWITEAWEDTRSILIKLVEKNIFPVCSPIMRSSVIDRVGLFREELSALEDWEYWIRCAVVGIEFHYYAAIGTDSLIRTHGASMTQESGQIRYAGYVHRLFSHKVLPLGDVRNVNLALMLQANSILGIKGRNRRYNQMFQVSYTLRECIIVVVSRLCDAGGPLHYITRRLSRCLPWRFRSKLANMGLNFGN